MNWTRKVLPPILVLAIAIAIVGARAARSTGDSGDSPLYESTLRQAYAEMHTVRTEVASEPPQGGSIELSKPTQRPGKKTVCPENPDPTKCPKNPTKCPVIPTVCPEKPDPTNCPYEKTYCPRKREYTKCEVTHHSEAPTQCDRLTMSGCKAKTLCEPKKSGVTSCPKVPTTCYRKKTLCPPVHTSCPRHRTKCPIVRTVCPEEQEPTKCPWVPTKCPRKTIPTECPTKSTECPPSPTQCPEEPTKCPPKPTECHVYTECEVTHNPNAPTECEYAPTICEAYTWCPPIPGQCPPSDGGAGYRGDAGAEYSKHGPAVSSSTHLTDEVPTLFRCRPNPFSGAARIAYFIPQQTHVAIRVYDVTGRAIATLVDEDKPDGYHTVTWDGTGLDSGVYFYRMTADGLVFTGKATLVR